MSSEAPSRSQHYYASKGDGRIANTKELSIDLIADPIRMRFLKSRYAFSYKFINRYVLCMSFARGDRPYPEKFVAGIVGNNSHEV